MSLGTELRLGETIETGTTGFTAQCYELYTIPSLGSLVKTISGGVEIYGFVYNAVTSGIEPGRKPIARGRDETSEDAIYRTNPQLIKLLKSEFSALVTGFRQDKKIYRYLPPQPARIHSFVYQCNRDEVNDFSASLEFLSVLLNSRLEISTEELVAASLRQVSLVHEDRRAFLIAAGKELAVLLSGQYFRLKLILEKLQI
jgi:hypothetical protein